MTVWSLEKLIDPVGADEFFSAYFEKQKLLVRRNRPGYFGDLLSIDDIDRILTTEESKAREVTVVDASRKVSSAEYLYGDKTVRIDQVYKLHEAGGTIILNHLHRRHAPLADLCAALELEFSAGFQTNVYLTPPAAKGFHPHYDTHDVLVLQLAGSKRWQLYDTPFPLTLKGHGDHARQHDPGPVKEDFEMRAGDTLYIPRGLVHDAISTDENSLHVTVGIMSWTWFDFLLEAVESLAVSDEDIRAALPRAFASANHDPDAFRQTFSDLAGRLAGVDPSAIRKRFAERFFDRRPPLLRHQMDALGQAHMLDETSLVGCRPYLAYLIEEDDDQVHLRFHRNEFSLPLYAASALRYALETPRFHIRDLPGSLDDNGKIVLIRRLVREGLVQPLLD